MVSGPPPAFAGLCDRRPPERFPQNSRFDFGRLGDVPDGDQLALRGLGLRRIGRLFLSRGFLRRLGLLLSGRFFLRTCHVNYLSWCVVGFSRPSALRRIELEKSCRRRLECR